MIATTTLVILINSVRPTNFKLKYDYQLAKLAEQRCVEMPEYSHKLFLSDYSKRIEKLGYNNTGENLGLGFGTSTKSLFKAFEKSKTHREINHSKNYQKIGIGTCTKPGVTPIPLTVVLFAGN